MKIKRCPRCKSIKVEMYAGFVTGTWQCKSCRYVGSLILEEDYEKNKAGDKRNPQEDENRKAHACTGEGS